jgi:hypothetical protein
VEAVGVVEQQHDGDRDDGEQEEQIHALRPPAGGACLRLWFWFSISPKLGRRGAAKRLQPGPRVGKISEN